MRVAIGSDHAGFELKEILIAELNAWGDPIGGPGRYIRTFTAGVHSAAHTKKSGKTTAMMNIRPTPGH